MIKKIYALMLILAIMAGISACSTGKAYDIDKSAVSESTEGKIQVLVSFNALKEFTEAVGKDKVEVKTMIPDGVEPHDFEPKIKDMKDLSNAQIFVYNGFGMEGWVDKTLQSIDNKKLVIVEAAKGADGIKNTANDEHGQYDPHLWLSVKGAEVEAENIKKALVEVDPSNKSFYEANYKEFLSKMEKLYSDYNSKFSSITNKNFVTGHAAFAYLCRDFGLKQNSIEDVFADGEPSPQKLKELTDYCKVNNIKTIFVEDLVSPKVSETLAKEVGAKVVKIYTAESKEENKDYTQCMEENLQNIYNSIK